MSPRSLLPLDVLSGRVGDMHGAKRPSSCAPLSSTGSIDTWDYRTGAVVQSADFTTLRIWFLHLFMLPKEPISAVRKKSTYPMSNRRSSRSMRAPACSDNRIHASCLTKATPAIKRGSRVRLAAKSGRRRALRRPPGWRSCSPSRASYTPVRDSLPPRPPYREPGMT